MERVDFTYAQRYVHTEAELYVGLRIFPVNKFGAAAAIAWCVSNSEILPIHYKIWCRILPNYDLVRLIVVFHRPLSTVVGEHVE